MTENNFQEEQNEAQNDNPQTETEDVSQDSDKIERYKQQISWSKAENERMQNLLLDTYKNLAEKDATVLDDLHSKDPKLANRVAKEFWYDDYNDLYKTMNKSEEQKSWLSEDDLEDWYTKRRAKEQHSEALLEAKNIISKLPEEVKEKAQEYFDDITEWKTLTIKKAKDFAEMATLYVNKDKIKDEKYSTAMVDAMTTWVWKSKAQTDKVSKDTKDLADAMWFGKFFE